MGREIRAFLIGFTNAFRPVNYANTDDLGIISKRINHKIMISRSETLGKINKITAQTSRSETYK